MFKKNILLAAALVSTTLLTGCIGTPKPGDTTPVAVPNAEIIPTPEELKAQMSGHGYKIILSPVEYGNSYDKVFATEIYDDISQRLLKSGNTVVDRTLAAKLKDELLAAEASGKFRTSGPAVADIAIMTKIASVKYSSKFSEASYWTDKKGKSHKTDASCSFSSKAQLYVRAYKVPSMELINTYEYEGSSSFSTDTNRSSCPITDASANGLMTNALKDAIKSGSGETLNDLAPEAYVVERRDNADASKSLFRVTIAKRSGAMKGAAVKFYRKKSHITPITNEVRIEKSLLGEGEIIAEGIDAQGAYVYVDDKELINELKIGDIAKLDHGKCDVGEYEVFGSCVKVPSF
ncbi:MAG: hypothetical protein KJ609_13890 [Gammaproteobacteria bacterium]|nr:hypothetical protein [Gammaproteobacteria bacterium]MBU1464789.1 hypothetical protein [Gammaproteobacteria bacterium]MBU2022532.1 hypothetical protein [Gammaproteobacteria bacterium]MBU2238484.1 hypothetical protein [Gammaproteobacteria bacterium]MBU2319637.1 hypothetical protein [Gammaproteobacteria bacterium]